MKNYLTLFTLFLCVAFNANSQSNKIVFEEYDLANGMHVILHEDHATPIVAVTIMYHVGSKNEDPEKTGFAHFFEHLLFEGSDNIARGEYDSYVENAGGTLNANTTYDRTFYYEILPSNQLELGLWLESERLMHAKVESKGIETQREVVKEEKRLRVDNRPYGKIISETMKRVYQVHPYKWAVIGSMDHIDAATESDYVNFYKTFYVPNNAVLSIAGDIKISEAKNLISKYFGTIPKGTKPVYRPSVIEPPMTKEVRDTVYDNIQLPAVIHAFRIPEQGSPDFYAMDMLGNVLSQGQSSRMYRSLVDEKQLAIQAGLFAFGLEDPGVSLSFAICNAGIDPQLAEQAMEAEYDNIKKDLISDNEYQKLRNQIENDFITSNSSVAGIAESLADYYMYFGETNLINTEIDRYLSVTKEDIKRVANKYLLKNNRVTLYYLPQPN